MLRQLDFILPAILFLAQFAAFSFLAFHRLIDSDEGFYLYISKLIFTEGAVPYKDVFYQQMPLLPYLYGAWMKVFGFNWEAGRAFSAFLAALIGTLLFQHIRKTSGAVWLALSSLALYALNLSVLLFFLTAKTYVLSASLLLGSLIAGVGGREGRTGWGEAASGLLLALSVQTRLFFAAAVPVLGLWLWRRRDSADGRRKFRLFIAGFALGMVPALIFMGIAPRQFIYDNLLYHGMRDPAGLVGDLEQKLNVAKKLLISPRTLRPTQFSFLLSGIPLALVFWRKMGELPKLAAVTAIVLGLVSLLPTPTFGQYFCVLVPLLTIVLADAYALAIEAVSNQRARRALMLGFVLVSIAYATATLHRIGPLFFRGEGVPGIAPLTNSHDWKISTVKEISDLIETNTDENSVVVSTWPGYLLTIDRRIYPKMENQIAIGTAWKLSSEEADKFRMMCETDLVDAIADPNVQTVVAGNCTHGSRLLYNQATSQNGYMLLLRVGRSEIFVRQPLLDSPTISIKEQIDAFSNLPEELP